MEELNAQKLFELELLLANEGEGLFQVAEAKKDLPRDIRYGLGFFGKQLGHVAVGLGEIRREFELYQLLEKQKAALLEKEKAKKGHETGNG